MLYDNHERWNLTILSIPSHVNTKKSRLGRGEIADFKLSGYEVDERLNSFLAIHCKTQSSWRRDDNWIFVTIFLSVDTETHCKLFEARFYNSLLQLLTKEIDCLLGSIKLLQHQAKVIFSPWFHKPFRLSHIDGLVEISGEESSLDINLDLFQIFKLQRSTGKCKTTNLHDKLPEQTSLHNRSLVFGCIQQL